MPNFSAWLSASSGLSPTAQAQERAAAAWRRIQDKPSAIQLYRGGSYLAVQTFRFEPSSTRDAQRTPTPMGTRAASVNLLFGVRDHATVTNADIKVGDRFWIDGAEYDVRDIFLYPGEVQAQVERRG